MRKRLGEANWNSFVRYANAYHKESFVRAFTPTSGMLCCKGSINGTPCPNQFQINLTQANLAQCATLLPILHMDHTHDVKHICEVWSQALPAQPRSWDDGICGPLIAHLLFGTEDSPLTQCSDRPVWRKQIEFRCGNVNGVAGQNAGDFCHDVASPHYTHTLRVSDIQWPAPLQKSLYAADGETVADDETVADEETVDTPSEWSATCMSSQGSIA